MKPENNKPFTSTQEVVHKVKEFIHLNSFEVIKKDLWTMYSTSITSELLDCHTDRDRITCTYEELLIFFSSLVNILDE